MVKWLIKIAAVEDFLVPLGVSPDVVRWVSSLDDTKMQGWYANQLRQNPGMNLEQLQSLNPMPKQGYEPTKRELERVQEYQVSPDFWRWSLVQLRRMRMGKPFEASWGTDFDYNLAMVVFDNSLSQIYDWYLDEHPEIASYSWEQAVAATNQWHHEQAEKGRAKDYDGSQRPIFTTKNGWSVVQVMSKNDLQAEGYKMNHCVGSYCDDEGFQNGSTFILSLRDPKNEPHVTIEVDNTGGVKQIQGKSNSEPKPEYVKILKAFFASPKAKQWLGQTSDLADAQFYNERYQDTWETLERIENVRDEPRRIADIIDGIGVETDEYGLDHDIRDIEVHSLYDGMMTSMLQNGAALQGDYYPDIHGRIAEKIAELAYASDKALVARNPQLPKEDWIEYSQIHALTKIIRSWEKNTYKDLGVSLGEDLNSQTARNWSEEERDRFKNSWERQIRLTLPIALGDEVEKQLLEMKKKFGPIKNREGRVYY